MSDLDMQHLHHELLIRNERLTAELNAKVRECEALTNKAAEHRDGRLAALEQVAAARGLIERLEAALRKYGQHIGHCRFIIDPCRCGFDAALASTDTGEK